MTKLTPIAFIETDLDAVSQREGRIGVLVTPDTAPGEAAQRLDELTGGAIARLMADDHFGKSKPGDIKTLAFPTGVAAEAIDVVHLQAGASADDARKAGAALAKVRGSSDLLVLTGADCRRLRWR